jgi:hypothetical protein
MRSGRRQVFGWVRAPARRRLSQVALGCACVSLIGCGASHSAARSSKPQYAQASTVPMTAAAVHTPAHTSTRRSRAHSPSPGRSAPRLDPASKPHAPSSAARRVQRTSHPRPGPTAPRPDRRSTPLARAWKKTHRTGRVHSTGRHTWSPASPGSATGAAPQTSAPAPQSTASGW